MTVKRIEILESMNFETQMRLCEDGRLLYYTLTHQYPPKYFDMKPLTGSIIKHNAIWIAYQIYLKYAFDMTNDGQDKELFNKIIHSTVDLMRIRIDLVQKTATVRTFEFECSGTFEDDENYKELMEHLEKLK